MPYDSYNSLNMGRVAKINFTLFVQSAEKLSTLLCTDFIVIYELLCFSVVCVVVIQFFFACYKCYGNRATCKAKMAKIAII